MLGASYTFMTAVPPDAKRDHTPRLRRPASGTIGIVLLGFSRLFAAFDARAVSVAVVVGGVATGRLQAFARVPLLAGQLVPSPSGENVPFPDAVRDALRHAVEAAGRGAGAATLVLPEGIARLALLPLPPNAEARDFARFRLGASLPFPVSEAIVEALPAGRARAVGAAVRRGVVAEYERVAASVGLVCERVHLAPLLAIEALRARARDGAHIVLGDTAGCFVVVRAGGVEALRSRRRDSSPGEAGRLLAEAGRVARLAGLVDARVTFSGSDAARLRGEGGVPDEDPLASPAGPVESAEAAWLPGAVA
jgi:hypothetical protein